MNVLEAIVKRRSVYGIDANINASSPEIEKLVADILYHMPSAFNGQTQRVLLLHGKSHHDFWKLVLDQLRRIVPESDFPRTNKKISGFDQGWGTILFFDATSSTDMLRKKYPLYRKNIDSWVLQQNGMLQYAMWVAFAERGIGANLQHYNELVEGKINAMFKLPPSWKLLAQMPFGGILIHPDEKSKISLDERLIIRK